jgi:hypothetical protein
MHYESNMTSVMVDLAAKLKGLSAILQDKCTKEIASDLMFSNKSRVYTEGEDVKGGKIGSYSQKATLIGASSFRTKSGAKKAFSQIKKQQRAGQKISKSLSKWRTVNKHHLAIFNEGYKGIRKLDGDETAYVNLSRTKKMMKDLTFGKVGSVWCVGFPANYNGKLPYKEMVDGFRKKYKKQIWGVSASDEKVIDQVLERYLTLK